MHNSLSTKPITFLTFLVPFAAIFSLWEALDLFGLVRPNVLPPPMASVVALYKLAQTGNLFNDIGITLLRTAAALAISIPVGIFVGLLVGWYKLAYKILGLTIFIFFSIPKLSLYTIIMFIFGFTNQSVIVLSYLASIFPVLFSSIAASRSIDRIYILAARDNYANGWQIFTRVLIPNSLPTIGAGIKLTVGVAFVETITAELYQAPGGQGLGYVLLTSGTYGQADAAFGVLMITILLGGIILLGSEYIERRLSRWRKRLSQHR